MQLHSQQFVSLVAQTLPKSYFFEGSLIQYDYTSVTISYFKRVIQILKQDTFFTLKSGYRVILNRQASYAILR